jgi:hypothetical protein
MRRPSGAISGDNSAITAATQFDAQMMTLIIGDKSLSLKPGHLRDVVYIELTHRAGSHSIIAIHILPNSRTGSRYGDVIEIHSALK